MNESFLYENKKHIHFIGIGGVSMSSLAKVMHSRGVLVSGSDANKTKTTTALEELGIKITYEHLPQNVEGADLVVYTAAIKNDNPEFKGAVDKNIEMAERSVFLGELMRAYKYPCCIAGTHGKTTTTSMAGIVMQDADVDPTVMVGGEVKELDGNLRIGESDFFITESCEYVESFLEFYPHTAIILNVDEDHLDYFTGIDHIISSFAKFVDLVPKDGLVIANGEDENALKAVKMSKAPVLTFGFSEKYDYYATRISYNKAGCATYTLNEHENEIGEISLSVPGKHNILNSMSVAIYALKAGVPFEKISRSLNSFGGTKRRFERIGEYNGAILIDDYAHHPTEIKATMQSARNFEDKKITAVFQSHTYTRTKALLKEFSESFDLADEIIVTDIFAAREKDLGKVHPNDLVDLLKKRGKDAKYIKEFKDIADYLKEIASPDHLFITIGAGDVFKVLDMLK